MTYFVLDSQEVLFEGTQDERARWLFQRGQTLRNKALAELGRPSDAPFTGTFDPSVHPFEAWLDSKGLSRWGERGVELEEM